MLISLECSLQIYFFTKLLLYASCRSCASTIFSSAIDFCNIFLNVHIFDELNQLITNSLYFPSYRLRKFLVGITQHVLTLCFTALVFRETFVIYIIKKQLCFTVRPSVRPSVTSLQLLYRNKYKNVNKNEQNIMELGVYANILK